MRQKSCIVMYSLQYLGESIQCSYPLRVWDLRWSKALRHLTSEVCGKFNDGAEIRALHLQFDQGFQEFLRFKTLFKQAWNLDMVTWWSTSKKSYNDILIYILYHLYQGHVTLKEHIFWLRCPSSPKWSFLISAESDVGNPRWTAAISSWNLPGFVWCQTTMQRETRCVRHWKLGQLDQWHHEFCWDPKLLVNTWWIRAGFSWVIIYCNTSVFGDVIGYFGGTCSPRRKQWQAARHCMYLEVWLDKWDCNQHKIKSQLPLRWC